jgi:hypothetical protein
MIDAIVNDKPIHPDFDDAVKTQMVLERVKDSVKSGKWENCS